MQSLRGAFRRAIQHAKHSPVGLKVRRVGRIAFSDKYLLYTNVAISVSLSTTGDVIEQHYEIFTEELDVWDQPRTGMMAFSGVGVGVFCHYWYKLLDRLIHGRTIDQVAKKLLLDQLICSPIMISIFFVFTSLLEEDPIKEFTDEMRTKFLTLYLAEWVVWPPAQVLNFYFLPTRFRVLYDNIISLGYDVYTSKVKHDKTLTSPKTNVQSIERLKSNNESVEGPKVVNTNIA